MSERKQSNLVYCDDVVLCRAFVITTTPFSVESNAAAADDDDDKAIWCSLAVAEEKPPRRSLAFLPCFTFPCIWMVDSECHDIRIDIQGSYKALRVPIYSL